MNGAEIEINGKKVSVALNEVQFKTGSKGYRGFAKLEVSPTERYQLQIQAVLIGSKEKKQE